MIELTKEQKVALIEYLLADIGKGPFEDLDIFQTAEVEENFDEYRKAASKFVFNVKKKLISQIDETPEQMWVYRMKDHSVALLWQAPTI